MSDLVNPFTQDGNWYKANLHTHTDASDGNASLNEAVTRYRQAGYDVLAITDHHCTHDVSELSDDKMLVISGIEYHPPIDGTDRLYHLVGLNMPHGFEFHDGPEATDCIEEIAQAGGQTILAHPYWCGFQYADFKHLTGVIALEVWNSACDPCGRPGSESEWAYALDRGWKLPAVAVDDTHWRDDVDLFAAWTCLKMPSVTVENVLEAVRTGSCYSSCGPEIHDFRVEDGKASVRCSPAARIHFVSCPGGYGKRLAAAPGQTIEDFAIDVSDEMPYLRAVVTDSQGRKAWTNPIWL